MSMKTPEDMTMEEIREQLAIYNRLFFFTTSEDRRKDICRKNAILP